MNAAVLQDTLLVTYTLFPSVMPSEKTERADVPWSDLAGRIHNAPIYIDKQHCPLVSLAEYGDIKTERGCIRHADNVRRVFGAELDYDGEQMPLEQAQSLLSNAGIEAILYTSPSHTPSRPRWRALLPFSEPALPEKRAEYLARANRILGGVASSESFTLSQSFYVGRVRGATYEVAETHGRCIDMAGEVDPLYAEGKTSLQAWDSTPDKELRAIIGGDDALSQRLKLPRYQAMLKRTSRLAACGMEPDDIEAVVLTELGESPEPFHSNGKNPRTVVKDMVASAVANFGESRRAQLARNHAAVGDALAEADSLAQVMEQLPVEAYAEDVAAVREVSPTPKRRPMDWDALDGKLPPDRIWHINEWLTEGPTLLAGLGGIGKTLIAQTIATALALRINFIERIDRPYKVLFWACEDPHDELWRRQAAICRYFGVDMKALKDKLIIEPRKGEENTLLAPAFGRPVWTPLRAELEAQIKDYGAEVLVLDNIGQTFGCNENDRHHATMFMNGLAGMAPASLILGHPAKATGSEFSGSTAWENAVRMRWYLSTHRPDQKPPEDEAQQEDLKERWLSKRKANYSEKTCCKLIFRDKVLVPEAAPEQSFSQRYTFGQRQEEAERVVLEAIATLKGVGQYGRPTKQSRGDYLPRKIIEWKLAKGVDEAGLADAMQRLMLSQRIVEAVVGKLANRSGERRGLVIPDTS